MKNYKAAALLGIAAAAGYGVFKLLSSERVQATVYAVASNTASAACETGGHVVKAVKDIKNKEVSAEQAIKDCFSNIKVSVGENMAECLDDLNTINAVYGMDDVEENEVIIKSEPNEADINVDEIQVDTDDLFEKVQDELAEEVMADLDDSNIEIEDSGDAFDIDKEDIEDIGIELGIIEDQVVLEEFEAAVDDLNTELDTIADEIESEVMDSVDQLDIFEEEK